MDGVGPIEELAWLSQPVGKANTSDFTKPLP